MRRRLGAAPKVGFAVITMLATVASVSGCGLFAQAPKPTPTVTSDAHVKDVFTLSIGDCLLDPNKAGETSTATTIDCAKPHNSEVYDVFSLADGAYPGDDEVRGQSIDGCRKSFKTFIGVARDDSELNYSYYYPTEHSWTTSDDRAVTCLVYDPAGRVSGTLANAER
ncbi:MAG: hypothetical protein EPN91_06940 [Salinibacterium sp.]|nr:MAG: hypothetical protein EPN91_06940 [Salinibacterium sp.]